MPRFNPAPGWPTAPEGWLPDAGWQPDPSWPPAPEGWQVVVEDGPRRGVVDAARERLAERKADKAAQLEAERADGRIFDFESHIAGRNARVRLYPDRVEWDRADRMSTGAKALTAAATFGTSYLATGFTHNRDTEVIYAKAITSVTTKRHVMNTTLTIIASGNTIEMKVSHDEAERAKRELNMLAGGVHPAQSRPIEAASQTVTGSAPSGPSLAELADLHRQGILTDDEFTAAKRKALGL